MATPSSKAGLWCLRVKYWSVYQASLQKLFRCGFTLSFKLLELRLGRLLI